MIDFSRYFSLFFLNIFPDSCALSGGRGLRSCRFFTIFSDASTEFADPAKGRYS
jgi:hypothetical protein